MHVIPDVWDVNGNMEFSTWIKILVAPGDRRWNTLKATSTNHISRYQSINQSVLYFREQPEAYSRDKQVDRRAKKNPEKNQSIDQSIKKF